MTPEIGECPVLIITEDFPTLDTTTYDMVQHTGRVYAGLARHNPFITHTFSLERNIFMGVTLFWTLKSEGT
ncbi:MAG: hypothetical protein JRK53_07295 [Deltaproteobacteria bacterium]|nr:hypothetical protein [Deltaproteobacteria bacterium]MBW1816950.1 hypothetical protein [Deltaproteobacteria bacterium]